jgi:hypothetical protein
MIRRLSWILVLGILAGVAPCVHAQQKPALFYSLPEEGTWVEYNWEAVSRDGKKQTGTLRITSGGRRDINDVACRTVEIIKHIKEPSTSEDRVRKLLVSERAFQKTHALAESVVEAYEQNGPRAKEVLLSAQRREDFISLNLRALDDAWKQISASEKVEVPLGKYTARHVTAKGRMEERKLSYDGWLTDDVPFGWAKFEMHDCSGDEPKRVFRASAVSTSRKAAQSPR